MTEAKQEIKIGDEVGDGTILAGFYEGKPLYTTSRDAPLSYSFNEAQGRAEFNNKRGNFGHKDWRVPTKDELNVLFENRNEGALKGTFNETGSNTAGWYWSSSPSTNFTNWGQNFSNGEMYDFSRGSDMSLRCVRG